MASNFVKTRFRRSPTFHLSTLKTKFTIFVFVVEKCNVGDRLKRVFPKFHADRSHFRPFSDSRRRQRPYRQRRRKKKSFDRGGPVWPPRSNAADDRLGEGLGGLCPLSQKPGGLGGSAPQRKVNQKVYRRHLCYKSFNRVQNINAQITD